MIKTLPADTYEKAFSRYLDGQITLDELRRVDVPTTIYRTTITNSGSSRKIKLHAVKSVIGRTLRR